MALRVGATLTIAISDPFELSQVIECELVGVDAFATGSDTETVLVRAPRPLRRAGRAYEFLALRGRRAPGIVDELGLGQSVECNGFGVGSALAAGGPPWGVNSWRGGLGVLAQARATRA